MATTISDLPDGIIDLIGKKMISPEDFIRFGAVCKSWKSSMELLKNKVSFPPWLMLATYDYKHHHKGEFQKFFSLTSQRIHNLHLPETNGRRCFGSPFGWVVTVDMNLDINLLNPFKKTQLSLPPQSTFSRQFKRGISFKITARHLRNCFVHRFMVIQTGHEQSSCVVMAIHSGLASLSFARPGDSSWTLVEDGSRNHYSDVIFYNGEFYGISGGAYGGVYVVVIDISNPSHPKAVDFASRPESVFDGNLYYLVEMNGALLFVEQCITDSDEIGYTTRFLEVHEFDFSTKTWKYVDDLGDYALFVGTNTSFSIKVGEFEDLKPNCIYYTDNHFMASRKCYDMGVYDMEKEEIEPIYSGDHIWSHFSRPIFVRPCL